MLALSKLPGEQGPNSATPQNGLFRTLLADVRHHSSIHDLSHHATTAQDGRPKNSLRTVWQDVLQDRTSEPSPAGSFVSPSITIVIYPAIIRGSVL